MSDVLAELLPEWHDDGRPFIVVLPHVLWSRVFIGTKLMMETDTGDVCAAFVEVGPGDAPVLRWPVDLDPLARRITVRLPR